MSETTIGDTLNYHAIKEARQLAFDDLFTSFETYEDLAIDRQFPQEFANTLARREVYNKHLFRPNTYLHKWWARRCGSTFRTILKQFVADPQRRDYYAPRGLEGKVVLDPMMGGGTTLHEAIRLGASVIGADIDPIPVVQARATLSEVSLTTLETEFATFFDKLYARLGDLFQTECPHCDSTVDLQYTLHGLRKRCGCREVIQVDSYLIREEAEKSYFLCPDQRQIVTTPCEEVRNSDGSTLLTKSDTVCLNCGQKYEDLLDEPFYKRYVPVVIVGQCVNHGLFLRTPGEADIARIELADRQRSKFETIDPISFNISDGPKSGDLLKRNVHSYQDLFSSRQLIYLSSAVKLLSDYSGAVRLNLGLLISTSLEFNSLMCGYKGSSKNRPGAIRHVFALHAYSFPYTAAENNPVNQKRASGNLKQLFRDRLVRGRKWSAAPIERRIDSSGSSRLVGIPGEWDGGVEVETQCELTENGQAFWLIHGDSSSLPVAAQSVDFIVTDPPYYDNVQYSNLAEFFRVWLARLLPDEIDWDYDVNLSAVASGSGNSNTSFVGGLSGIFQECSRVLKHDVGRMVFTFHHWDPIAWAELTIALRSAGFRLVNTHVVFSENPVSVHINNLNAILHDAVLVLAVADHVSIPHWAALPTIETDDSESFCWQCGAVLGCMLEHDFSNEEIRTNWRTLMKDTANGNSIR